MLSRLTQFFYVSSEVSDDVVNHDDFIGEESAARGVELTFSRSFADKLIKVLAFTSFMEPAAAYCTNYGGVHGPTLWRNVDDVNAHNDGVCGIFQIPGSNGERIPLVVSYDQNLVGNLSQRILNHCPNVTSWIIPDNWYFPAFNEIKNYCGGGIYREQAVAWEYFRDQHKGIHPNTADMECIRNQIGCSRQSWDSWTFWFKSVLIMITVGIPLTVVGSLALRKHLKSLNENPDQVTEVTPLITLPTVEPEEAGNLPSLV